MTTHLSSISAFVPVTWFGSRVESHLSNGQILRKSCDFEYKLRPNQKAAFDLLDGHIENSISLLSNVKFLSQNEILNYKFPRDFMNCKKILWDDGDHLSGFGEELIGKRLPDNFLSY